MLRVPPVSATPLLPSHGGLKRHLDLPAILKEDALKKIYKRKIRETRTVLLLSASDEAAIEDASRIPFPPAHAWHVQHKPGKQQGAWHVE